MQKNRSSSRSFYFFLIFATKNPSNNSSGPTRSVPGIAFGSNGRSVQVLRLNSLTRALRDLHSPLLRLSRWSRPSHVRILRASALFLTVLPAFSRIFPQVPLRFLSGRHRPALLRFRFRCRARLRGSGRRKRNRQAFLRPPPSRRFRMPPAFPDCILTFPTAPYSSRRP